MARTLPMSEFTIPVRRGNETRPLRVRNPDGGVGQVEVWLGSLSNAERFVVYTIHDCRKFAAGIVREHFPLCGPLRTAEDQKSMVAEFADLIARIARL